MRKYIEEIIGHGGLKHIPIEGEDRQFKYDVQRKTYGFDSRETWNLDASMIELLYERVRMYVDVTMVDTTFHKITINKKKKTQEQWIDHLIVLCEAYLLTAENDFLNDEMKTKLQKEIWTIWSELAPYMWW